MVVYYVRGWKANKNKQKGGSHKKMSKVPKRRLKYRNWGWPTKISGIEGVGEWATKMISEKNTPAPLT